MSPYRHESACLRVEIGLGIMLEPPLFEITSCFAELDIDENLRREICHRNLNVVHQATIMT